MVSHVTLWGDSRDNATKTASVLPKRPPEPFAPGSMTILEAVPSPLKSAIRPTSVENGTTQAAVNAHYQARLAPVRTATLLPPGCLKIIRPDEPVTNMKGESFSSAKENRAICIREKSLEEKPETKPEAKPFSPSLPTKTVEQVVPRVNTTPIHPTFSRQVICSRDEYCSYWKRQTEQMKQTKARTRRRLPDPL